VRIAVMIHLCLESSCYCKRKWCSSSSSSRLAALLQQLMLCNVGWSCFTPGLHSSKTLHKWNTKFLFKWVFHGRLRDFQPHPVSCTVSGKRELWNVCVCVHIYIYIYCIYSVCVCMCVYVYIYIYIYIYTCLYSMHTFLYTVYIYLFLMQ